MKTMKITAPQGFEIDKDKSTFEEIVFKPIVKELPKSINELQEIVGYYTNGFGKTAKAKYSDINCSNLSTQLFATDEQAEASIALAQLSQLRKVYRGDEKEIDFTDGQTKYCIVFHSNKATVDECRQLHRFLSFYSEDTCELFLENFRDLIEKAKPLMS